MAEKQNSNEAERPAVSRRDLFNIIGSVPVFAAAAVAAEPALHHHELAAAAPMRIKGHTNAKFSTISSGVLSAFSATSSSPLTIAAGARARLVCRSFWTIGSHSAPARI